VPFPAIFLRTDAATGGRAAEAADAAAAAPPLRMHAHVRTRAAAPRTAAADTGPTLLLPNTVVPAPFATSAIHLRDGTWGGGVTLKTPAN
jgi:hypothetical protein